MCKWDRAALRDEIWLLLKAENNLGLFANRRLGKTFLMQNYLLEESKDNGFQAAYCDLQSESSCEGAVKEIIGELQRLQGVKAILWQQVKARFKNAIDGNGDSVISMVNSVNWKELLFIVLDSLNREGKAKYFIMLDEITVCLANVLEEDLAQGKELLNTLRKARLNYPNIKWLMTGSIGIDNLADRYQLSGSINDLTPVTMLPLKESEAKKFIEHLGRTAKRSYQFDDEMLDKVLAKIGWLSPYYIEELCIRIELSLDPQADRPTSIDERQLDTVLQVLYKYPYNRIFKTYPDNIERHYPLAIKPLARKILGYLCQSATGETLMTIEHFIGQEYSVETIRATLKILVDDGYLVVRGKHYCFSNRLLAEYWRRYED